MCVLSNQDIVRRVREGSLVIEPFDVGSVGPETVDLHLSGVFLSFERTWVVESVDLAEQVANGFLTGQIGLCTHTTELCSAIPTVTLRPGQVIVAYVEEYIEIPTNLVGIVDGKSKWAQLGLQVASAGIVHGGWKGQLVLELVNLGNVPLKLSRGVSICQISFHALTSQVLSLEELQVLWKGGGNV